VELLFRAVPLTFDNWLENEGHARYFRTPWWQNDSRQLPIYCRHRQGHSTGKDFVKQISISTFLGVLLALAIIAELQPLPPGAVALVVFLSIGTATVIGTLLHKRTKGSPKNE
jgi:hypothetical protein